MSQVSHLNIAKMPLKQLLCIGIAENLECET